MDDVASFDRFARYYDLVMPRANTSELATGLAHAERPVARILDLAGGSGRGVRSIVEAGIGPARDADTLVVDAAAGMARRARAHGVAAVLGDAGRIPLRTGAVDAVLVVDALHHLPDRERALAEARRVLAPGGVLVIADFDPETVRGRALVAAEHLVGFESEFVAPDALAGSLAAVGFQRVEVVDGGFGFVLAAVASGKSEG